MTKKILFLLLSFILLSTPVWAQDSNFPMLTIEEEDGTPSTIPWKFKVPNGSLTSNADYSSSLSFSAVGDLLYLKLDQSTPQAVTGGAPNFSSGLGIGTVPSFLFHLLYPTAANDTLARFQGSGGAGVQNMTDIYADAAGFLLYRMYRAGVETIRLDSGEGTGTFGTLTVGSGSITDSSGAISLGDENVSFTGTLGAGATTLSGALAMGGNAITNAGAITGTSFTSNSITNVNDDFRAVWVDTSDNVWGVFDTGLKKSTDKGVTFVASDTIAASGTEVGKMVFQATNGYLYWSQWSDSGAALIRRSIDGGTNWTTELSFVTLEGGIWGITEDVSGGAYDGYLYAGVYGSTDCRIFRSTDNGDNWTAVYTYTGPGGSNYHVHNVKCDPYTGYVYATTGDAGAGGVNDQILRSIDGGANWTILASGNAYRCIAIAFLPTMRIFGDDLLGKIWTTTDDSAFVLAYRAPSGTFSYAATEYNGRVYIAQFAYSNGWAPPIISTTDGVYWRDEYISPSTGVSGGGVEYLSNPDSNGIIYASMRFVGNNFRSTLLPSIESQNILANGIISAYGNYMQVYHPTYEHVGYIVENADVRAGMELETQSVPALGEGIFNIGINTGRLFTEKGTDPTAAWMRFDTRAGVNKCNWYYEAAGSDTEVSPMALYLATGNLELTGAITGTAVKCPLIFPPSDSTTAVKITKADGATTVATIDTTNTRFGVGITPIATGHYYKAGSCGVIVENDSAIGRGGMEIESSLPIMNIGINTNRAITEKGDNQIGMWMRIDARSGQEKFVFYHEAAGSNTETAVGYIDSGGNLNLTGVLDATATDGGVALRARINATQANITAADTFAGFYSTTGLEGSITGTATAGLLAYNTFTGSHYTNVIDKTGLETNMLLEIIEGEPEFSEEAAPKPQLFKTKICSTRQSKAAVGVYGGTDNEGRDMCLSLGTGFMWVANKGVNLEIGDYLTSSDVKGCVEKQDDDIYHNYTVAKITQSVKWNSLEQKRLVKVIYEGG